MLVVTYTCVCPYLDIQGSRDKIPHGHFCDPELESLSFRGQSPFQIFSAVTLLADRLGQYAIGDKPLRNRECFRHLSYFTFARSAHVVTMAVTNPIRIELMLAVLETAVIPLHQRLRRKPWQ